MPAQKSLSEVESRDMAIARRQVEVTRDGLKHKWPHHVALPAEKVRYLGEQTGGIFRGRCPVGDAAHVLPAP
jgi:hypothetical protein